MPSVALANRDPVARSRGVAAKLYQVDRGFLRLCRCQKLCLPDRLLRLCKTINGVAPLQLSQIIAADLMRLRCLGRFAQVFEKIRIFLSNKLGIMWFNTNA